MSQKQMELIKLLKDKNLELIRRNGVLRSQIGQINAMAKEYINRWKTSQELLKHAEYVALTFKNRRERPWYVKLYNIFEGSK